MAEKGFSERIQEQSGKFLEQRARAAALRAIALERESIIMSKGYAGKDTKAALDALDKRRMELKDLSKPFPKVIIPATSGYAAQQGTGSGSSGAALVPPLTEVSRVFSTVRIVDPYDINFFIEYKRIDSILFQDLNGTEFRLVLNPD